MKLRYHAILLVVTLPLLTAFSARPASAQSYTDGFEGTTINPFWTVTGPGTATLTNSIAHSGSQSLELSASSDFPWAVKVQHHFGAEQTGTVSVWVQGQQLADGSGVGLQIEDASNWLAVLQQAGNDNDTSLFVARVNGSPETDHDFSATPSVWHQFEITAGSNGLTFDFDGATVFTNPSVTNFQSVDLTVWGGPGGTAYVDDFVFTPTPQNVVPEPSTLSLLAGVAVSGAGLAFRRLRGRR